MRASEGRFWEVRELPFAIKKIREARKQSPGNLFTLGPRTPIHQVFFTTDTQRLVELPHHAEARPISAILPEAPNNSVFFLLSAEHARGPYQSSCREVSSKRYPR